MGGRLRVGGGGGPLRVGGGGGPISTGLLMVNAQIYQLTFQLVFK